MLRTKKDVTSVDKLKVVEDELSHKYSETMFNKIMGEVKGAEDCED